MLSEQDNDVAELVEASIRQNREKAEKAELTIIGKLDENISLKADVSRLNQIISSLLNNAIKFSPKGGIIHVEMLRGQEGQFILSIRDAGIGIAAADVERIFENFNQADSGHSRRFGGVGLGLSIARRIARLHGGDVKLESTAGAGTTALLVMPADRVRWPGAEKIKQVA